MDWFTQWGALPEARTPSLWPADMVRHLRRMFSTRAAGRPLRDLIAECEVGDVLLFSGAGLAAAIEELTTWSDASHVGIVIYYNERLCVLHAMPHAAPGNLLAGGGGLNICPLSTYLPYYLRHEGIDIWLRKLVIPVDADQSVSGSDGRRVHEDYCEQIAATRRAINQAAIEYCEKHTGWPFLRQPTALVQVAYPMLGWVLTGVFRLLGYVGGTTVKDMVEVQRHAVYCSQLVAAIYQLSGVFTKDVMRTHFGTYGKEGIRPANFTEYYQPVETSLRWNEKIDALPFARCCLGPAICAM